MTTANQNQDPNENLENTGDPDDQSGAGTGDAATATTNTTDNEEADLPNFLSMSDEELAAYDVGNFNKKAEAKDPAKTEEADPENKAATTTANEGNAGTKGDPNVVDPNTDSGAGKTGSGNEVKADTTTKTAETKAEGGDAATTGTEGAKVNEQIDYEAVYKELFTPFKANGRDIKVDSVADARALMQMGANYNKKMQALKPSMKIMKLLESNGLLDESKISFLIDLEKRDPAAINKLVADSKLDPLDLSAEKAAEYQPKTYKIDERELELDAVLQELQGSEHYNRTLEVVSDKWDIKSREIIVSHPEILTVINEHMANGVYDVTAAKLENERMLGRFKGISDIEAYKQIADKLYAEGAFTKLLESGSTTKPATEVKTPAPVKPAPAKLSKSEQEAIDAKKRAAGTTKTAAPSGKALPADFNPLNMSDEEFAKLDAVKLFK